MIRIKYIILFLIILSFNNIWSQEVVVPVEIQSKFIIKSLAFVKDFTPKSNDQLKIGIIYQSKNKISYDIKEEFEKSIQAHPSHKMYGPINLKLIDLSKTENIYGELEDVSIAYVTPFRAYNIKKIVENCQSLNILSISSVPEYVKSGIILGFNLYNSSPKINININSLKQTGINFRSSFFKVAQIIKTTK